MTENKIYACEDHIEIAIDDYVNKQEEAPVMNKVSEDEHIKCSYCENKANYELL